MKVKVFISIDDYDVDIEKIVAIRDCGDFCIIHADQLKIDYNGKKEEFYDLVNKTMSKVQELTLEEKELFKIVVVEKKE